MKLMMMIIFALMAICISANAIEITNGPYNIKFNADSFGDSIISTKQENTETLDGIPYTQYITLYINASHPRDEGVYFVIGKYPDGVNPPINPELVKNPMLTPRLIDGYKGHVIQVVPGTPLGDKGYVAYYNLSANELVLISSTYSWDDGTLELLKSIHITKEDETK